MYEMELSAIVAIRKYPYLVPRNLDDKLKVE